MMFNDYFAVKFVIRILHRDEKNSGLNDSFTKVKNKVTIMITLQNISLAANA